VDAQPSSASAHWADRLDGADVPVLPDVTDQVLRLASDPNASLAQVAQALSRDVAAAAHVMRLANSALHRGREPIVTLQQAAARLGTQKLRDVAVMVAAESKLFRARGFEAEARAAYGHGLLTGLWAQEIARKLRGPVEEAFLCGLLHDVGVPVLLQLAVERVPGAAERRAVILADVDARHAVVGAELARRWKLPERTVAALERHHAPVPDGAVAPKDVLAVIVVLADAVAEACEVADVDVDAVVRVIGAHPAAAALNFYDEDIAAVAALWPKIEETVGQMRAT
jgi:putative nucleotidyltransferase with HDIG domain